MAANAKGRILNLSDHERARRSLGTAESGRILNDCRDLAMRRLSAPLKDMLAQVEEDLFQMAEETYNREMQNLYLEVRGNAKEKWPKIETACSRNLVDAVNRKARGQIGSAVQSGRRLRRLIETPRERLNPGERLTNWQLAIVESRMLICASRGEGFLATQEDCARCGSSHQAKTGLLRRPNDNFCVRD